MFDLKVYVKSEETDYFFSRLSTREHKVFLLTHNCNEEEKIRLKNVRRAYQNRIYAKESRERSKRLYLNITNKLIETEFQLQKEKRIRKKKIQQELYKNVHWKKLLLKRIVQV